MKVNPRKSEAVLLGGWRNKPPKLIHYPIKGVVKYLGCLVGNITQDTLEQVYRDMEAKITNTFAR